MKILYDYQAFSWQKFGGVSNCFVKLMTNLPKTTTFDIAIRETDNIHLLDENIDGIIPCKHPGDRFLTKSFFPGKYRIYKYFTKLFPTFTTDGVNELVAKEKLRKGDFDIFHPTFFDNYFLKYIGKKPFVLTIHDMIPELVYETQRDPQIEAKRVLATKAAHIIAISNQTKKDIIKVLKVPENKISVVYHGAPTIPDNLDSFNFEFNYLLFVGGRRQPYKNFIPMLKSIASVLLKHKDLKLVCTGEKFNKDELQLIKLLKLEEKVTHYFCDDIGMMKLYKGAKAFIFPSLYEGFGIPILEAYATDCPLLLNKKSCFPEIAGEAAVYFNLDNKNDDLNIILEDFLSWNTNKIEFLIKKQRERVKLFAWEKAAIDLNKVYQKVLNIK